MCRNLRRNVFSHKMLENHKQPPNKAVEAMEMHKMPPTWLGLDMMLCGPVVCSSLKFVSYKNRWP